MVKYICCEENLVLSLPGVRYSIFLVCIC